MRRSRKKHDEVSYWESMTDSMIGLLLCILLLSIMLVLYMVWTQDNEKYTGDEDTVLVATETTVPIATHIDDYYGDGDGDYDESDDDDGGGGGYGHDVEEETHLYDDPDPGDGEASEKAAVLVQVVDEETQRTLKLEGIDFELYGQGSALQSLFTYYPLKIQYNDYETDENGEFYLPEKINFGNYRFHCISDIEGYDTPDDVSFKIDQEYDWDSPYVVTINVSPSKNIVCVQLNDAEDGTSITGSDFNVVALDDIITADGTVRYHKGDLASTITLDENGYGESEEIFLGAYSVEQNEIPQYYAPVEDEVEVEVLSKKQTLSVHTILESKTKAKIQVSDELYPSSPIAGGVFRLETNKGKVIETYTTDEKGKFTVTNLEKNTTYRLVQVSTIKDYRLNTEEFSFTVSGVGLIEEQDTYELTIPNRLIRISVGMKDYIFKNQISDVSLAICEGEETIIRSWDTTGIEQSLEGLEPGDYVVIIDGNKDKAQKITIEDTAEIQEFNFKKITILDIGTMIGAGIGFIGIIVLIVFLLRRLFSGKSKEEGEQ